MGALLLAEPGSCLNIVLPLCSQSKALGLAIQISPEALCNDTAAGLRCKVKIPPLFCALCSELGLQMFSDT